MTMAKDDQLRQAEDILRKIVKVHRYYAPMRSQLERQKSILRASVGEDSAELAEAILLYFEQWLPGELKP